MNLIIHYGIRKKHKMIKRDEISLCADSSGRPGYIGRWYDVFYSRSPLEIEIHWKEGFNRVICCCPYYLDEFDGLQDTLDAIVDDDRLSGVPEHRIKEMYEAFCDKYGRRFTFLEPGQVWKGNLNRLLMGELLKNDMKATDNFKQTIKSYLDDRATKDELFAISYTKPTKNIDDCITYVLNTVKSSGKNGFTDDEIYNMVVHYYDEDDVKVGKPVSGVVVNHSAGKIEEEQPGKSALPVTKPVPGKPVTQKPKKKMNPVNLEQLSLFGNATED